MKKHLVKIWFDIPGGTNRIYEGFVRGKERNGKVVISASKLFKAAFGYELPAYSKYILL